MRQMRCLGYLAFSLLLSSVQLGCCTIHTGRHPAWAGQDSADDGSVEYFDELGVNSAGIASDGGVLESENGESCGCGSHAATTGQFQQGMACGTNSGCGSGGCGKLDYGDPFADLDVPEEPRPIGRFHAVPTCNVFQASAIESQIPKPVIILSEPLPVPRQMPKSTDAEPLHINEMPDEVPPQNEMPPQKKIPPQNKPESVPDPMSGPMPGPMTSKEKSSPTVAVDLNSNHSVLVPKTIPLELQLDTPKVASIVRIKSDESKKTKSTTEDTTKKPEIRRTRFQWRTTDSSK